MASPVDVLAATAKLEVAAEWAANAPLAMVHQYIFSLRRVMAVAFHAGTGDKGIHATHLTLHAVLKTALSNTWGSYDGIT
jgi:S-formylglutathione hydrolase